MKKKEIAVEREGGEEKPNIAFSRLRIAEMIDDRTVPHVSHAKARIRAHNTDMFSICVFLEDSRSDNSKSMSKSKDFLVCVKNN